MICRHCGGVQLGKIFWSGDLPKKICHCDIDIKYQKQLDKIQKIYDQKDSNWLQGYIRKREEKPEQTKPFQSPSGEKTQADRVLQK